MPHPIAKNIKRQHRLVVKPDYQGIGIGAKMSNYISNKIIEMGYRVTSTTSAPSLIYSRKHNPRWYLREVGRKKMNNDKSSIKGMKRSSSASRITTAWEFK
jgi:GNAT superfamily N-acetyltransferase